MATQYDVFEILLDRSVKWRLCVRNKQRAIDLLKALGNQTFNECFATDLWTREIIGRVNVRANWCTLGSSSARLT